MTLRRFYVIPEIITSFLRQHRRPLLHVNILGLFSNASRCLLVAAMDFTLYVMLNNSLDPALPLLELRFTTTNISP